MNGKWTYMMLQNLVKPKFKFQPFRRIRWLSTTSNGDNDEEDEWKARKYTYLDDSMTSFGSQATLEAVSMKVKQFTSCGIQTFRLNGRQVKGPVLVTTNLLFSWNVQNGNFATVRDLKIEDFELLTKITPTISLIILGTGGKLEYPDAKLLKQMRDIAPVEICDSLMATGLFNMLNKEERYLAGCMLPVQKWEEGRS